MHRRKHRYVSNPAFSVVPFVNDTAIGGSLKAVLAERLGGPDVLRLTEVPGEGDTFVIEITDDGTSAAHGADGSGLRGMRERAAQYGGSLEAGPALGRGWRVRATFPIEHVPA